MLEKRFNDLFGRQPSITNFTPGRVNLIGEHTDYNGGMVLPTALKLGISIAFSPSANLTSRIASDRFDDFIEITENESRRGDWSDYALGAIKYAQKAGFIEYGADIYIKSTLPDGAGLSSSAALIVGILKAARELAQSSMSDRDIAVLARRVENEFIGMPCGIMDQMAVAVANQRQAIALNTKSLNYDVIDLPSAYHIAVVHSGQHRKLSDGRYADRKHECDQARALLGTEDLCLLDDEQLKMLERLPEPISRRAMHCATEHRRTVKASEALKAQNMDSFGALMKQSHLSMRDDFEMSLPEIDRLVESASNLGAIGARLTGGGFGGCIVACVRNEILKKWQDALLAEHPNARIIC